MSLELDYHPPIEAKQKLPPVPLVTHHEVNTTSKEPRILEGSLDKETTIEWAVDCIDKGIPIALQMGNIIGLFGDAQKPEVMEKILEFKGEQKPLDKSDASTEKRKRPSKVFSLIMKSQDAKDLIDDSNLKPKARELLKSGLEHNVGALAHIRAPLKRAYITPDENGHTTLPQHAFSIEKDEKTGEEYARIQYLDPQGHDDMTNFLDQLKTRGINYLGVTSMNYKGQNEITQFEEAQQFCVDNNIPLLIKDNSKAREDIKGSFPIVDLLKLSLERDGDMADLLEYTMGTQLDTSNTKKAKHEKHDFSPLKSLIREEGLAPEIARVIGLMYKQGYSLENIRTQIEHAKTIYPDALPRISEASHTYREAE